MRSYHRGEHAAPQNTAPLSDVVLSTRARLARNITGAPFPHRASDDDLSRVAKTIQTAVKRIDSRVLRSPHTINVSTLSDVEKAELVDAHLTSVEHVLAGRHRFAVIGDSKTVSILINEEDHIRVQVILPGMQAENVWKKADSIDDSLSKHLPIAFDEHFGYLTTSLPNCGMGLRMSIMVHLPALGLLDRLDATWGAAHSLDAIVRGLYGEGVSVPGNIYQVSNSLSMGSTEPQTVGKITAVATYLEAEESGARQRLLQTRGDDLAALVSDAEQRLANAQRFSLHEGIETLSALRLGYLLGFDTRVTDGVFADLVASLRGGASLVTGEDDRARDVFFEDNRRPAMFRNRIRAAPAHLGPPPPLAP